MKVKKLQHHNDGVWTWRIGDSENVYFTDRHGDGLFVQYAKDGSVCQLMGTCQFIGPSSISGMRKKLNKMYSE